MMKISQLKGFPKKFKGIQRDNEGNPILRNGKPVEGYETLIVHYHPGYIPKELR